MADDLKDFALFYHRYPVPGKLEVVATKPLANQRDLALAYSPGVAAACEAIVEDANEVFGMTSRGNLVAVISNGTAVLGLGNIGALASKPVMEGKAVLFKKFSGIDVFDIEIDETDPQAFIDTVARLEPTFGGINLEDIKAPECFEIEQALRQRMKVPVFHDDQHGTAIIVGAAVLNGLRVVGKRIEDVKLVASGAGAAALACLNQLISLGLPMEHITVTDLKGVVYKGRTELMDQWKGPFAKDTEARTLGEVIGGADVFLGLSAPGVLKPDMVASMAEKPLILALANPTPEIMPELAKQVRPDAIIATGRSDYPNQVNNVLCFPYIFRGALDVGATTINEEMKLACVRAIADLAMAEPSELVTKAYGGESIKFGPEFLIPKPFDPRLISSIAPAVARAAMESGVATRPIQDFHQYRQRLVQFVFKSGFVMKPIFDRAKQNPKRIVYAEGEDNRVLLAAQQLIDEGLVQPILVGRQSIIEAGVTEYALRMRHGEDYQIVDPHSDETYLNYWTQYHEIAGRKGVSPEEARTLTRTNNTVMAALMLERGDADAMICGLVGRFSKHLKHVLDIIGKRSGVVDVSTLSGAILPGGTFFVCDSYITPDPTAEELAEMTMLAAAEVRAFGLIPKVALVSHSSFGSHDTPSAVKMRQALTILRDRHPNLEVEGEMHSDAALSEDIRSRIFPRSRLKGQANLLVMPNLDAANIGFNLLKMTGNGISLGPILLGARKPAHVLTPSVTVRAIVNMSALTVVQAQDHANG